MAAPAAAPATAPSAPPGTWIVDATDADFQEKVLLASQDIPVLVDFWAPWCGPCKTLTPTLEKLANEYAGRFRLVKVNVDECPYVAQAFRIQSIPTVFLLVGGQPVDGFQGAQPENAVRKMLDTHVAAPRLDPLAAGQAALREGRLAEAAASFHEAVAAGERVGEAYLGLARVALAQNDPVAAEASLGKIEALDPAATEAERLRGALGFSADTGDESALQAKVDADPKDVASWYSLGATRATRGAWAEACEAFLQVVMRDRAFREDAGQKALLAVFGVLGADDEVTTRYRRRLAALLF